MATLLIDTESDEFSTALASHITREDFIKYLKESSDKLKLKLANRVNDELLAKGQGFAMMSRLAVVNTVNSALQ